MKNIILSILLIASVALGALYANQSGKLRKQGAQLEEAQQKLAALEADLKEKSEAIEKAQETEAKAKLLQKTLTESTSAAVEQSKKSEELKQSLAEAKTNNPMHSMAAMFKDPKMREMMKSQQKAFMGPIINKQYSDLFKQLNMTPEQTATLKGLMQNKMLAGVDVGMSMMDDSLDASQRADLQKQVKSQTDEMDNQIKEFLGDENYKSYQSYEKSVPDRMAVGQFNDQFAGTPNALSADQQSQLVQALSDARNNFKWTSGLNQQNPGANGDMASLLTPDNIDKFVAERAQFDNNFLVRAQQILTPDQLNAYKEFQETQRNMQIAGLKMAGQMLGK
jgi:hypothetical protein